MKSKEVWSTLKEEYKMYPDDFANKVPAYDIKKAEKDLCIKFSEEYKKFLSSYGAAVLPGHIIYGLSHMSIMGNTNKDVVEKTSFYRQQKWPYTNDLYVISDDGFGNPIGIDAKGLVWLIDPSTKPEKIKLADGFCDFLSKLFLDTLYE